MINRLIGEVRQLSPLQVVAGEAGTVLFLAGSLTVFGAPIQILGVLLLAGSFFFARSLRGALRGLALNLLTYLALVLILAGILWIDRTTEATGGADETMTPR